MHLLDEIRQLAEQARQNFQEALHQKSQDALERARIKYIGASGEVKLLKKRIKDVAEEFRREVGQQINGLDEELKQVYEEVKSALSTAQPRQSSFDPTEPLPEELQSQVGKRHPLTRTVDLFRDLLRALGFEVVEGPEVEDERHNFDDLNIPADHPARDSFDTFFISKNALLRSQTSTVQIRIMETRKPPLRVIAPGRVYRPDKIDATHASTFHQIEGLCVEKGVSMADLKGTLQHFMTGLFGEDTRIRFRPSFFPFTEPSAEVDCTCPACGGMGCNVCKGTGWVEMGGCGMVDPAVFEAINRARGDNAYDPEIWTGFAFGFGIERLCMRRHGINDLRLFLENDLRFLRQL